MAADKKSRKNSRQKVNVNLRGMRDDEDIVPYDHIP